MKNNFLLLITLIGFFASCYKQYPENNKKTFRDPYRKYIHGKWKLYYYSFNGVDASSQIDPTFDCIQFDFTNETYDPNYPDVNSYYLRDICKDINYKGQYGKSLDGKKRVFVMATRTFIDSLSPIKFNIPAIGCSHCFNHKWTIQKIWKDDFWLAYKDTFGNNHEIKFWRQN